MKCLNGYVLLSTKIIVSMVMATINQSSRAKSQVSVSYSCRRHHIFKPETQKEWKCECLLHLFPSALE